MGLPYRWGPFVCRALGRYNILDVGKQFRGFLRDEISQHRAHEEGNYIEKHLAESEATRNPGSSFSGQDGYSNLLFSLASVFLAGTDTAASFLEWFVLYMTAFPEVQERCFEEIKSNVGLERSVNLEDKTRTPYMEATIQEIQRHCPHLALTVQHFTLEDTKIEGHFIPKGTQVFYHSGSVFRDPKLFKNPGEFNPERFLDSEGGFLNDEKVIYFGTGKRRCAGEILGRAEVYLFSASLLQTLKMRAPEDADSTARLSQASRELARARSQGPLARNTPRPTCLSVACTSVARNRSAP